jgi:hypothetical protein
MILRRISVSVRREEGREEVEKKRKIMSVRNWTYRYAAANVCLVASVAAPIITGLMPGMLAKSVALLAWRPSIKLVREVCGRPKGKTALATAFAQVDPSLERTMVRQTETCIKG